MLKNISKSRVISRDVKVCRSVWSKFWGLMFSGKNKIEDSYIFEFSDEKKVSLHMFFVFYPIDLIFLDRHKIVTELKVGFMPFSIYQPRQKAKYVIECRHGLVEKSNTWIGDKIKF